MASRACITSIVTPSSSSTSLSPLHAHLFHSFTHLSPKPLVKSLTLKRHNFTLSHPPPFLFPLHLCHSSSSSAFGNVESDFSDELVENPVDVEADEVQRDSVENDEKAPNAASDDGRLYVGNLPYSMTSSQLSDIFSQAGHIKSVEIIYDKMTDRSRGFGFVIMESIDEAREAIRMFDASQIGGRTVRVNFPEVPRGGERNMMGDKFRISNQSFVDTPHKIYAGNLGWSVTTQGLRDAFEEQPGFVSAKVVYERETGRSRGFGFISFSSPDAAQSALSTMNGMELDGRPLRLNIAADRSRPNSG
ncbi:RNA-binding protein CP33, chloroplastic-like [Silene latifolia]|uniref:RNA-binding protein CP33, chloroplastic-like n=1 Tax=Silene latifolia TaxID=37657 RepID=UPI003D7802E7